MGIKLHNTLTRTKEEFVPLDPSLVGMYVCGPTVYGDPHLGHARPAVTFDVLLRLLRHEGFKVRYVRNITDVGHLENDGDEGEDKLEKRARLERLEPMEVAHYYTERYHRAMDALGVLSPSIEPQASGHVIEQIEMTRRILDKGFAYESNGSVYFDVERYDKEYKYGRLSGRVLDEMVAGTRTLDGQGDKRGPFDFALWKKASPGHIMRWPSPWSDGFPGWHLECSTMSRKYLGERFDIHGGGMDLMFPHHDCELAQTTAACGAGTSARYWVHNNMITIGGQKMGKSLGNFITLEQFFTGDHALLSQAYAPMTIRFFILQAHYRSTLDFSDEALQAAEKGFDRLRKAWVLLRSEKIAPAAETTLLKPSEDPLEVCLEHLRDDMNTPQAIAELFTWIPEINKAAEGKAGVTREHLDVLRRAFDVVLGDLLGLTPGEAAAEGSQERLAGLVEMALEARNAAKAAKDWAASDAIRDRLAALGIRIKDRKDGTDWEII